MTTPVQIGTGPSVPPISISSQEMEGPRRSIGPQEVRDAKPLDASITRIYYKHRYHKPTWSRLISIKFSDESSTNVYARSRMNFTSDTVLYKIQKFMYLGISSVHTSDELRSIFSPKNRIGRLTHGSNWLLCIHCISEVTADIVSGAESKYNYNYKVFLKLGETKW